VGTKQNLPLDKMLKKNLLWRRAKKNSGPLPFFICRTIYQLCEKDGQLRILPQYRHVQAHWGLAGNRRRKNSRVRQKRKRRLPPGKRALPFENANAYLRPKRRRHDFLRWRRCPSAFGFAKLSGRNLLGQNQCL